MLPTETLVEILANLRRRDLDALELINRALGSLVAEKFSDEPRRVISLMFYDEAHVMLTSPSDGWRRVPIVELPQYLPRSVIAKMIFKSTNTKTHSITEEKYQALLPCSAHFADDAVCDFRSLFAFPPDIFHRALEEVVTCSALIFGRYDATCLDVNGALEWLLGTHGTATGVKRLAIEEIFEQSWDTFLGAFVVAVEQQFATATTPASFSVELHCSVAGGRGPDVGTTRERENANTNERLEVVVEWAVRKGEYPHKKTVTIRRKPIAQ